MMFSPELPEQRDSLNFFAFIGTGKPRLKQPSGSYVRVTLTYSCEKDQSRGNGGQERLTEERVHLDGITWGCEKFFQPD